MKSLFIISLLVCFCGCSKPEKTHNSQSGISVTDFRGKTVELQKPAKRIVCLLESALSGIYMLHGKDAVIGVSTNIYSNNVFPYYAALDERIKSKTLPTPGNWDFVNLESVVALHPDLVIIWSSQTETIQNLESYHIPVYAVMIRGTKDIYKEITDIGILIDKHSRADSIIDYTKKELSALKFQPPRMAKVYFMWSQGILETSGTNSTVNELIQAAGCVNVCQSPQEHLSINIETLLAWNPDIILMWCNEKLDPADILINPSLRSIRAVTDRKVYELPSQFECDLWTLKFQFVVKLLASYAHTDGTALDLHHEEAKMLAFLYGKDLTELK